MKTKENIIFRINSFHHFIWIQNSSGAVHFQGFFECTFIWQSIYL
jgi:hypothetical protein